MDLTQLLTTEVIAAFFALLTSWVVWRTAKLQSAGAHTADAFEKTAV